MHTSIGLADARVHTADCVLHELLHARPRCQQTHSACASYTPRRLYICYTGCYVKRVSAACPPQVDARACCQTRFLQSLVAHLPLQAAQPSLGHCFLQPLAALCITRLPGGGGGGEAGFTRTAMITVLVQEGV